MPKKRKDPGGAKRLVLQPRLRLQYDSEHAFGPGKAELLSAIASTGSIRSAATRMGMSYNRAWILVREMNRFFRHPVVVAERGGDSGGGAALTKTGEEALSIYQTMEHICRESTSAQWSRFRSLVGK